MSKEKEKTIWDDIEIRKYIDVIPFAGGVKVEVHRLVEALEDLYEEGKDKGEPLSM